MHLWIGISSFGPKYYIGFFLPSICRFCISMSTKLILQNMSIWKSTYSEFNADFRSEGKFQRNAFFKSFTLTKTFQGSCNFFEKLFFGIICFLVHSLQIFLQTLNQHKIQDILIPQRPIFNRKKSLLEIAFCIF